jgi:hypothetical protein
MLSKDMKGLCLLSHSERSHNVGSCHRYECSPDVESCVVLRDRIAFTVLERGVTLHVGSPGNTCFSSISLEYLAVRVKD